MRFAHLAAGLVLAACGGEARTSLPLTAPAGVHQLVKDFIEVCSLAVGDREAGEKLAAERGWEAAADMALMKQAGVSVFNDPTSNSILQIASLVYPHLEGTSCFIVAPYVDPADIEPARIGETKGLMGDYSVIKGPDDVGRGAWSLIGPDGAVVTISVTATGQRILQMNMNTSRRVTPKT